MEHAFREILSRCFVDPGAAYILVSFAVLLDLMTLVMKLIKNIRGAGSSGIPVIQWFVYCYMVIFSRSPVPLPGHPEILFRFINLGILTGFHILCHSTLPQVHLRWIRRKRLE